MTELIRQDDGDPILLEDGYPLRAEYAPVTAASGPPFFVVELTVFRPTAGTLRRALGWARVPHARISLHPPQLEATEVIRASDVGYRTRADDPDGVRAYPALVTEAFAIDRAVPLDPGENAVSQGWGQVRLANDDGQFDAYASDWNGDRRRVAIYRGSKSWDDARGLWLDPPYAELVPVFVGLGMSWFFAETEVQIPIQGADYWLDAPLQTNQYQGTGGYEGGPDLTGKRKPKLRGGTALNPVRNITPVLIDAVNLVYQVSDGPVVITTLYEGAAAVFVYDGDVADLYAGTPPAIGHYRTNNARGLLQLGSRPVKALTCDAAGLFPVAGAVTTAAGLARYLLTEEMQLPAAYLDLASFDDAAAAYPYVAGLYFGPDDTVTGATAVSRALSSFGARLIGGRTGELRCFVLQALTGVEVPVARFDTTSIIGGLVPVALPATLDPPVWRARVVWQHNNTVQATDASAINAAATDAQLAFVAAADRYGSWLSTVTRLRYAQANDLAPFGSALLLQADAEAVAARTGARWGARNRLYDVPLPVEIGIARDIGDVVQLVYPMDDLRSGRLGIVVREALRSSEDLVTLRVLV